MAMEDSLIAELSDLLEVASRAAGKIEISYERGEISPRRELDQLVNALPRLEAAQEQLCALLNK